MVVRVLTCGGVVGRSEVEKVGVTGRSGRAEPVEVVIELSEGVAKVEEESTRGEVGGGGEEEETGGGGDSRSGGDGVWDLGGGRGIGGETERGGEITRGLRRAEMGEGGV